MKCCSLLERWPPLLGAGGKLISHRRRRQRLGVEGFPGYLHRRLRLQTIHGRPVHPECACYFRNGLPCIDPVDCLPPLMRRQLLRSSETHAAGLSALPALSGVGADQRALELGEPAQDGSMSWPCGVVALPVGR
jgi:hypothetical protein